MKTIFYKKKIISKLANIKNFEWVLNDVKIFEKKNSVFEQYVLEEYRVTSIYNYDKIINLFNNSNTISFIDLVFRYNVLKSKGYNNIFLNESLHSMLVFPFFLFLMTYCSI